MFRNGTERIDHCNQFRHLTTFSTNFVFYHDSVYNFVRNVFNIYNSIHIYKSYNSWNVVSNIYTSVHIYKIYNSWNVVYN